MNYTYGYLNEQALKGNVIGKWKGTPILPVSKNGFKMLKREGNLKADLCYLIYDDCNYMVQDNKVIGNLDLDGTVNLMRPFDYIKSPRKSAAVPPPDQQEAANLGEKEDGLSIAAIIEDIDKLLTSSCSWSEAYG